MLKPQEGFQEVALASPADIAFVGGSAGGGKTMLLLMESTRNVENPHYGGTIFRRTTTQIRNEGALWDTSQKVYPLLAGEPRESTLSWRFPWGSRMKFAHLEHDKNVLDYQGAQIPFMGFDELTHFSSYQFWYMVSRNRSDCGVRPYIRAGCNPDPKSWVAEVIEFYINQNTGYPIKAHAGRLRYFVRDGEALVWGDTKEEVIDKCPHIFRDERFADNPDIRMDDLVKSFTFIPGSIFENKIFIREDPTYLGTLLSLQPEEKARLLDGNWKISLDGLALCEWNMLKEIFDNYPEQARNPARRITVDAARFGKDFAVIFVWKGWEVIFTVVYKVSDALGLNEQIEALRQRFSVMRDDVIVDADGVGDGTVKLGSYTAFHGGHPPLRDERENIKLPYKNLKTQCYYRFCQKRVNTGQVRFTITSETCLVFDGTTAKGQLTTKILVGGKVTDIRDLIKADFATARRLETGNEGVDKTQMEPKEMQKNALKRSPDFADAAIMVEALELRPAKKAMRAEN